MGRVLEKEDISGIGLSTAASRGVSKDVRLVHADERDERDVDAKAEVALVMACYGFRRYRDHGIWWDVIAHTVNRARTLHMLSIYISTILGQHKLSHAQQTAQQSGSVLVPPQARISLDRSANSLLPPRSSDASRLRRRFDNRYRRTIS